MDGHMLDGLGEALKFLMIVCAPCGRLARATDAPDKFMGAVNALATGVINGNLLNVD
jgi:hypothetical protein